MAELEGCMLRLLLLLLLALALVGVVAVLGVADDTADDEAVEVAL